MKFTLIYSGPLRSTQSRSSQAKPQKTKEARKLIRQMISPQMKNLWETDYNLKKLQWDARVPDGRQTFFSGPDSPMYKYYEAPPKDAPQDGFVDLSAPIERGGMAFRPLIRESLGLSCTLRIHFLRAGAPGRLVDKSGDIDNRIKTFIDALEMPPQHLEGDEEAGINYPLLENDKLVRGLEISTDRLLLPVSPACDYVHLVTEVTVHVERPGSWNLCLLGR